MRPRTAQEKEVVALSATLPPISDKEIDEARRENRKSVLKLLLITFVLYTAVTCMIMRFAHPEYTETELFLNLPKALILNFK